MIPPEFGWLWRTQPFRLPACSEKHLFVTLEGGFSGAVGPHRAAPPGRGGDVDHNGLCWLSRGEKPVGQLWVSCCPVQSPGQHWEALPEAAAQGGSG